MPGSENSCSTIPWKISQLPISPVSYISCYVAIVVLGRKGR